MQENQPSSQPEIDLIQFFSPITTLIKKIWQGILYYFLLLRVNVGLFFSIILIIGLLGAGIRFVFKPAYQTEAVFISHEVPAEICKEMLDNLNSPYLRMGVELKISDPAAATIKDVDPTVLKPMVLRRTYDSLLYSNNDSLAIIQIKLVVWNFNYIDTIQNSLIRYLENSPYSQHKTAARKKALLNLRKSIEDKLQGMDSVQLLVNKSLQYKRDYANGDPINPMDGYETTLRYNKQKVAIDQELNTMDNIELLRPFTRYEKYNYPNYLQLFLLSLVFGLISSMIVTPLFGKKPKIG